jgi:translation initiation factor IF-3
LIRKFKPNQNKIYRLNQRIFASTLRVIDVEGKLIGILPKHEALKLAQDQELDLVEIAPKAVPPVAKIIDFNKFLYQQKKKQKDEKKKSKASETKEVRLGPFMSENDLSTVTKRAREFLMDGHKLRVVLKFKGRQIVHPEFGHKIIKKLSDSISDISKVEREPRFEGKQLVAILSVEKGKKNEEDKTKSTQISQ